MRSNIPAILSKYDLRITQPRQLVLETMLNTNKPLSHKDIHAKVTKSSGNISLVTVYRILETFERIGLVHRHLSTGGFILCCLQEEHGHHVLLSCEDCGSVEECSDTDFCKHEDRIAKSKGFSPKVHLSELIGVCSSCS